MVVNRVIDNAAVAAASLARKPVVSARSQALSHPVSIGGDGATVFGADAARHTSPEWAAWANGVAVRELDYHDTFLAAEYSHPGDNIPPIIAVAQHLAAKRGLTGRDLVRGIATGYEIQIDLVKAISPARAQDRPRRPPRPVGRGRHRHAARPRRGDDLPGHRPGAAHHHGHAAVAQGRDLDVEGARPRVRRQDGGRGGRPRDARRDQPRRRSTRAKTASSPGCSTAPRPPTRCRCPTPGEAKRAILDSYTKEHSAEYQAQAWIDLARKLHEEYPLILDAEHIESITLHTSHHTHFVIKTRVLSDTVVDEDDGTLLIENVVSVSGASVDDDLSNNTFTQRTFVQERADLKVTKVCKPDGELPAGQTGTCTIFVDNLGPSSARDIVLTDANLSDGAFTIGAVTPSQGTCGAPVGGVITCQLGDLDAASASSIGRATITVEVSANEAVDINDVVTVTSPTPDPVTANNQAQESISVMAVADLSIDKTGPPTGTPEPTSPTPSPFPTADRQRPRGVVITRRAVGRRDDPRR